MCIDYYNTAEKVEQYTNMAKDVNGANLIKMLGSYLKEGAEILELGSGPGSDWEILNERYNVLGSDFSSEFIKQLKSKFPEGTFEKVDASCIKTDKTFDAIYSNKVLHHLGDCELQNSIRSQYKNLNKGGIICHSFWNGDGIEDYNGMMVNMHTTDSLYSMFESRFEILVLDEYKEFDANDSVLLIARKID